ncbi:MAG: ABC transporter ATP-binding protein [Anaerolineales bacterium]|nr:ABC transporter ATP-binding protein [Anaerolineales bacterium]
MTVIRVEKIRKTYGKVVAVEDVSFEIRRGEIFGMVGPNGAGKTTTIECCEGLRRPDGGEVNVLGLDPQADGNALRKRIGVQLQSAALSPRIKVWEALDLFASFYPSAVDWKSLMERMGLAEKRNAYVSGLSGGQRQRLFIALSLLNDPELIFLDELTTGLDPQARRAMWDLVRDIREKGKTVFLTTHFMEEAERLCDRVAILDHGRIIALDTPPNLVHGLKAENRVVFFTDDPLPEDGIRAVPGVVRVDQTADRVVVCGRGDAIVAGVVNALGAKGIRYRDLRTEQATLDDVFLAMTGRELRD